MSEIVFVDTDVLIDISLGITEAVESFDKLKQPAISVITAMELYAGCRSKKDLRAVDELILNLKLYWLTASISELAFTLMKTYRSSHGVEINDLLIAATAINNRSSLFSKNQKHYAFIKGLDLLAYPTPKA